MLPTNFRSKFMTWVKNHPDVWHTEDTTEHFWWVQSLLADLYPYDHLEVERIAAVLRKLYQPKDDQPKLL